MRNWKRPIIKSLAISFVMGACFTAGAYAEDVLTKVEAYLRPDFTVRINGDAVALPESVLIYKDSSYLPFRTIAQILGATVSWDERTKSILLTQQAPPNYPGQIPGTGSSGTGYREITLGDVHRYNLIYNNINYPVLANLNGSSVYLRWSDLQLMPFDLSGVTLFTEKATKESYVHVDEVGQKWGGKVSMGLKNEPLYTGTLTLGQKKAIESYFGANQIIFSVRHLSENDFYAFVQRADKKYVGHSLRLSSYSNDYWVVSGSSQNEFQTVF